MLFRKLANILINKQVNTNIVMTRVPKDLNYMRMIWSW